MTSCSFVFAFWREKTKSAKILHCKVIITMMTPHEQMSRPLKVQSYIRGFCKKTQRHHHPSWSTWAKTWCSLVVAILTILCNCSVHAHTKSWPSLIMAVLILAIFYFKLPIAKIKLCQIKALYGTTESFKMLYLILLRSNAHTQVWEPEEWDNMKW